MSLVRQSKTVLGQQADARFPRHDLAAFAKFIFSSSPDRRSHAANVRSQSELCSERLLLLLVALRHHLV